MGDSFDWWPWSVCSCRAHYQNSSAFAGSVLNFYFAVKAQHLHLQSVAEAECRRSSDAAEQAYLKAFNRECPPDEASFAREHQVRCPNRVGFSWLQTVLQLATSLGDSLHCSKPSLLKGPGHGATPLYQHTRPCNFKVASRIAALFVTVLSTNVWANGAAAANTATGMLRCTRARNSARHLSCRKQRHHLCSHAAVHDDSAQRL